MSGGAQRIHDFAASITPQPSLAVTLARADAQAGARHFYSGALCR